MKTLIANSNIQEKKLRYEIIKLTADQLSSLSEPCYFPPFKKDYFVFLRLTGLTEKDFQEFIKRFYVMERKSQDLILKDIGTNVVLFMLHYFLSTKDVIAYQSTLVYLGIKFYGSEAIKYFRTFCNPDLFKYSLENLSKTHLFNTKKTIANAIYYLALEMDKKYRKVVLEFNDPLKISDFVYAYRTRIAQSTRALGRMYYKMKDKTGGFKAPQEYEEEGEFQKQKIEERGQRIIDEITKHITVYKQIDNKALNDAKTITKIDSNLASEIVKEITDLKYTKDIQFILEVYIREISNFSQMCGNEFFNHVRSLMAIKKTNKVVYFKQQIILLTEKAIKEAGLESKFNKLLPQSKFNVYLFVSDYLCMYLRNFICKKS
jgi:hypothetical protein